MNLDVIRSERQSRFTLLGAQPTNKLQTGGNFPLGTIPYKTQQFKEKRVIYNFLKRRIQTYVNKGTKKKQKTKTKQTFYQKTMSPHIADMFLC